MELAEREGASKLPLGNIEVETGMLAVLWAPESGECITGTEIVADSARPGGPLAIDGAALLVKVPSGNYIAWHDFVQSEENAARRLWLIKQPFH